MPNAFTSHLHPTETFSRAYLHPSTLSITPRLLTRNHDYLTHNTHPSTTLISRGLLLTPPSTSWLLATIQCLSSSTCTPMHLSFLCTSLSAQSTYSFGMHATVLCNDNASTSPQSRRVSYTAPHPHCPNTLEYYQCLQLHQ